MSFIENMDAFLLDAMTEHLRQQIDSFKDNPPLYREIILAAMSGEHVAPLVTVLNKSRPDLEFKIQKACSDRGINPALFSNKIKDYLDGIGELTASWSSDTAMSALAALFAPSFKEGDTLQSVVKKWITSSFDFNNEQHAQQVITFSKVQKVSALFERFQGVLKNWNQEIITAEQINDLNRQLEFYKEACLKHSSPQQASEEFNRQIQQFEQACDAFKKDSRYNWIENFFNQWTMANQFDATEVHAIIEPELQRLREMWRITQYENNVQLQELIQQAYTTLSSQEAFERIGNALKDQERLGTLYRDLQDPVMQEKYKVTSDFLDQQFPQEATDEIDITPYLINRLFLHAVTVHPEQWTKRFADCLGETCQYVAGGFTDQEETFQARALKKDSYPEALMQQLEYVQDYYQFLQGNKGDKPEPIDFFIPMKHFILTIEQLIAMLQFLPETQIATFINAQDNEFLKNLLDCTANLDKVLELLPEMKKTVLIESLDNEFLTNLIDCTADLDKVLGLLPETKKTALIESLDNEFLINLIKCAADVNKVLEPLPETKKTALMESLDNEFLINLIHCYPDLCMAVGGLSETKQTDFINSLENEFLKTLILDSDDLEVLRPLSATRISDFIKELDNKSLNRLMHDTRRVRLGFIDLSTTQITALLSALNNELLKDLIQSLTPCGEVLKYLSATRISDFIKELDNKSLNRLMHDTKDLTLELEHLSATQITAFVSALDNKLLEKSINSTASLNQVLQPLDETQKTALIEALNNEFLKYLIKNSSNISEVLQYLSETQITAFINALDNKLLKEMISSSSDLDKVLLPLTETQKTALMDALDSELLIILSKTCDDLRTMFKHLSKTKVPSFIKALDNDESKQEIAHFIAKDPELLNTVLDSMQNDQGKTMVTLFDDSDAKILHCALDYPESLRLILTRIPEEQKLVFLHTKVNGESILDKCIHHKITGFEPELGYSFVSTYLSIREYLAQEVSFGLADNVLHYASTFFYQPDPGRELVNRLNTCQSFEEVKTHLHDFVEKNFPSKMANVISFIIEEEKTENQVWRHNNLS